MSDNINIQKILKQKIPVLWEKVYSKDTRNRLIAAIKEIAEAVVDKCKEEAKTKAVEKYDNHETYYENHINKQSILNVKNMIDYGK